MKNVKNKLKSNAGFSLVELMVVIAIIGILTTIAVPSLNSFQASARKVQAKTDLSSMYTTYSSWQLKENTYVGTLNAVGYQATGNPTDRYYSAGYGDDSAWPIATGGKVWDSSVAATNYLPEGKCTGTLKPAAFSTTTTNGTMLLLTATGCPDNADQTNANKWTIDQNRALLETVAGP